MSANSAAAADSGSHSMANNTAIIHIHPVTRASSNPRLAQTPAAASSSNGAVAPSSPMLIDSASSSSTAAGPASGSRKRGAPSAASGEASPAKKPKAPKAPAHKAAEWNRLISELITTNRMDTPADGVVNRRVVTIEVNLLTLRGLSFHRELKDFDPKWLTGKFPNLTVNVTRKDLPCVLNDPIVNCQLIA